MASGGARNRSGPDADPSSLRSASRDIKYTQLPSEGFSGEVPEYPLPDSLLREVEVWKVLWRTPQACAWALESWRWHVVAMYVRTLVQSESVDAPNAALLAQIHRFGDQIGLTPAGLKENGWAIAVDEIAKKSGAKGNGPKRQSARDRMTVIDGDGA